MNTLTKWLVGSLVLMVILYAILFIGVPSLIYNFYNDLPKMYVRNYLAVWATFVIPILLAIVGLWQDRRRKTR